MKLGSENLKYFPTYGNFCNLFNSFGINPPNIVSSPNICKNPPQPFLPNKINKNPIEYTIVPNILFLFVMNAKNFLIPKTRNIPIKNKKLETIVILQLNPENIVETKERPPATVKSVPSDL